jgi:hypothetical protein
MKLVHSVLAAVGLVVIVALVIAALADSWSALMIATMVAAGAGLLTRLLVPRDQRRRLLERRQGARQPQ